MFSPVLCRLSSANSGAAVARGFAGLSPSEHAPAGAALVPSAFRSLMSERALETTGRVADFVTERVIPHEHEVGALADQRGMGSRACMRGSSGKLFFRTMQLNPRTLPPSTDPGVQLPGRPRGAVEERAPPAGGRAKGAG